MAAMAVVAVAALCTVDIALVGAVEYVGYVVPPFLAVVLLVDPFQFVRKRVFDK